MPELHPRASPRHLPVGSLDDPGAPAAPQPRARRHELRCGGCGYGAVAHSVPAQCPMCHEAQWDFVPWRPFSHLPDLGSLDLYRAGRAAHD